MNTPKLETDRLILRAIKIEDIDVIFDCWMQDKDVSKYMFWKASNDKNQTKKFVELEIDNINNDKWFRWIIEKKKQMML